jgi:hypothetical protein
VTLSPQRRPFPGPHIFHQSRPLRIAIAVFAAIGLVGCSSLSDRQSSVVETVAAFYSAVSDQDWEGACDLLAPATQEDVAGESSCADELSTVDVPDSASAGEVRVAEVWGQAAQVQSAGDVAFLALTRSGWKLTAVGCVSTEPKPYDCSVKGG